MRAVAVAGILAALSGCGGREAPVQPEPVAVRQRAADWGLLPAGTRIPIRTVTEIDVARTSAEQGWPAVIAGNVGDDPTGAVLASGAPARLIIIPGNPSSLGLAAVMVEGTWRSVVPVGAARANGAPLGSLVDVILESRPGAVQTVNKDIVRITGDNIRVPGPSLLIVELTQPARVVGVP